MQFKLGLPIILIAYIIIIYELTQYNGMFKDACGSSLNLALMRYNRVPCNGACVVFLNPNDGNS